MGRHNQRLTSFQKEGDTLIGPFRKRETLCQGRLSMKTALQSEEQSAAAQAQELPRIPAKPPKTGAKASPREFPREHG